MINSDNRHENTKLENETQAAKAAVAPDKALKSPCVDNFDQAQQKAC